MKKNSLSLIVLVIIFIGSNKIMAQNSSWVAPKSANDLQNPFVGDAAATAQGKKMYKQMCVICHGIKGDGKGIAGVSLNPKPSNFLSLDVSKESDGAIFWKMTEGKPPMASYKEMLKEDQRWKLVNYIRELEKK
jgi:mono/diheme cytochrome c family protein